MVRRDAFEKVRKSGTMFLQVSLYPWTSKINLNNDPDSHVSYSISWPYTLPPPFFFSLLSPPFFIYFDVPIVLLHSFCHFTLLHHKWIVGLSSSCLCASPVHHPQWPLKLPRKPTMFSRLKSCNTDAGHCSLYYSVSGEVDTNNWRGKNTIAANNLLQKKYM